MPTYSLIQNLMKKLIDFTMLTLMVSALNAMPPEPLVWDSPSTGSAGSMPIGNGDIGLNVWTQADGTIRTYIAKTDAWDGAGRLLRLGGSWRIFNPAWAC